MEISSLERKALLGASRTHERGFSIAQSLARNWKIYLFQMLIAGGAAIFFWWGGWSDMSMLFLGILVGTLSRDIAWFRMHKKLWPLSDRITNWDTVKQLLEEK